MLCTSNQFGNQNNETKSAHLLLVKLVEYPARDVFERRVAVLLAGDHVREQLLGGGRPVPLVTFLLALQVVLVTDLLAGMFGHLQLVPLLVVTPVHHL